MLFTQPRLGSEDSWRDYCKPVALGPSSPVLAFGAESFALLVDALAACITAGRSASTDAIADSTAIWVALHGTVSLKSSAPGLPWPEPVDFVRQLALRLARITPEPLA